MVLAKAFAVGIVTGLLAPVVVVVASLVTGLVTLFLGGFAATGGGASGGSSSVGPSSFDVYVPTTFGLPSSSGLLVTQIIAGFGVGFLFMLWRALVRRQAR